MYFLNAVLKLIWRIPILSRLVNRLVINYISRKTIPRPRAYSLWSNAPKPPEADKEGSISDYTSWRSVADRKYFGRHLPPADQTYIDSLPEDTAYNETTKQWGKITKLFERNGQMATSRSSLLFMFFAQWFTDSVLRFDPRDRRKNTSNHDVDLCQIYGLDEATTTLLRSKTDGKLRSQMIKDEEYLDYLCEADGLGGWKVKKCFMDLPYSGILDNIMEGFDLSRREKFYATGLERGNSSVGYVAISTIFMREHNRICDELKKNNSTWNDERLFQTARMINIVLLLKLVVEDYINHIFGHNL